jgi:hypothetical protein
MLVDKTKNKEKKQTWVGTASTKVILLEIARKFIKAISALSGQ